MQAFGRAALVLLPTALLVPVTHGAVDGERPLTVDDILKLSDVGRAAARPGSDTFVWEQSPPYDSLSDFGAGTTGTWQGSDFEILTVSPESSGPRRLFQPVAGTSYNLGSFSPDGRFLSLVAARDGKVRVAVYDFRRRRLREFPVAPRIVLGTGEFDVAWLGPHRLAIAAYPPGGGPWSLTFRREIGARLAASWAKSWKGIEPSVDQYDSSASDVIRPLAGRLVVIDLVSGDIRQLASGQFSGLHPSPDGKWLAAVRQSSLPQSTVEHPHLDWTWARSSLNVFSLGGNRGPREVAPELDVLPDSIVWNASSKEFAFFASKAGAELRSGDFRILDPLNSVVRTTSHMGLSLASQRARGGAQWPESAVWFGDALAVFARSTPGQPGTMAFEDIKSNGVVDPRTQVVSVSPHWFLLASDSAPHDLTPGMQTVSPFPVLANGSQFFVAGDGQVWQLDTSGPPALLFPRSTQRLDALANQSNMWHTGPTSGASIFTVAGPPGMLAQINFKEESPVLRFLASPPETSILALSSVGTLLSQVGVGKGSSLALIQPGSAPKMLGELNPILDEIAETRWMDFNYANSGSRRSQLSGCLLLPPDYQSGHKYPLIVEVYPDRPGGCAAPAARRRFAMGAYPTSYSEHLLAAKGFAVFRPDTGGGISRTPDGPQAALPAVVDRGIDAVLAAGYGDPTRVGLLGFSQGGFASLWLATQSQRYKAIVSLNGWSDLANSFFEMSWAQELVPAEMPNAGGAEKYLATAGTDFTMGGTPWEFPQRYVENSPLWRSDAVSAPVLLIHSDMDNLDDANYKMFFTSLYIQKKDARLLIYRGEGHSPSSPANIRDMWKNIFSWFDTYLKIKRDADGKVIPSE
jgi:dienelactone hydrolase